MHVHHVSTVMVYMTLDGRVEYNLLYSNAKPILYLPYLLVVEEKDMFRGRPNVTNSP